MHDFEKATFFEGCLPIEVMAHRGPDTLRFGPMKPVGLTDPRTGRRAVRGRAAAPGQPGGRPLQPRGIPDAAEVGRAGARLPADSRASSGRSSCGSAWCTATPTSTGRRCWPRRGRCGRARACSSPGRSPASRATWSRRRRGCWRASTRRPSPPARTPSAPPRTTAIGALAYYVSHADAAHYQPSNITFGIMSPLEPIDRRLRRDRKARNEAISARALCDLDRWIDAVGSRPQAVGSRRQLAADKT